LENFAVDVVLVSGRAVKGVVGLVGEEGEEREEGGAGRRRQEFDYFVRDAVGAGGFAYA
jgi:hypothetical protein